MKIGSQKLGHEYVLVRLSNGNVRKRKQQVTPLATFTCSKSGAFKQMKAPFELFVIPFDQSTAIVNPEMTKHDV